FETSGAPLPDLAEDLAAHSTLARLAVGHESLVGREDGDAHAAEHAGHVARTRVDAQAGLRDATQTGDRALAVGRVLELDLQLVAGLRLVLGDVPTRDVALALEDAGQGLLQLRRR